MSQSPAVAQKSSALDRYNKAWTATNTLIREGNSFSGNERNRCFLNTRGDRFADVSSTVNLDLIDDSRSIAVSDWDLDGDLDLWITNGTEPRIRFLRNDYHESNRFIAFRLQGTHSNRDAIGARLELRVRKQGLASARFRTVRAGDGFLGQSSKQIVVGLSEEETVEELVVRWPNGRRESYSGLSPNSRYRIVEGSRRADLLGPPKNSARRQEAVVRAPSSTEEARIVLVGRLPVGDFELFDQGKSIQLSSLRTTNKPLLLTLWASWCQPCLTELQEWAEHYDKLQDELKIVAVRIDDLDNHELDSTTSYPFDTMVGTRGTTKSLDVIQRTILDRKRPLPLPCSFLLDAHHQLAVIYKGPVGWQTIQNDLALLPLEPEELRERAIPFAGRWGIAPQVTDPMQIAVGFYESRLNDMAKSYTHQIVQYLQAGLGARYLNAEKRQKKIADAHAFRGVLMLEADQLDSAADAFRLAIQHSPNDLRAHMKLGECYTKLDRPDAALPLFRRAIDIAPNDPDLHYDLAVTLTALDQISDALPHYRKSLELRPYWPPAANNLAWILATYPVKQIRNGQEAVKLAQETCRRVNYRDPIGLDTLSAAYAEIGDFEKAIRFAKQAATIAENNDQFSFASRINKRSLLYEKGIPFRDP